MSSDSKIEAPPLSQQVFCSATSQKLWPLRSFNKLEDAFRCPICSDVINVAMTLDSCSHTFCSACIRRSLSYKQECPQCRMQTHTRNLRNNRAIDQTVRAFLAARRDLFAALSLLRIEAKRHVDLLTTDGSQPDPALLARYEKEQCGIDTEPPSYGSKVQCPLCLNEVLEGSIQRHVLGCLDQQNAPPTTPTPPSVHKRKPPSKTPPLLYHSMKTKALRERLEDLELPVPSSREDMIWVHKEYVLQNFIERDVYNAQCEWLKPAKKQDVVQRVWDLYRGRLTTNSNSTKNSKRRSSSMLSQTSSPTTQTSANTVDLTCSSSPQPVAPQQQAMQGSGSDFASLIAQVRARKKRKTATPSPSASEPSSSDNPHPVPTSGKQEATVSPSTSVKAEPQQLTPTASLSSVPTSAGKPTRPTLSGPSSRPPEWRAVWSSKCNAVFYWNTKTGIGQFAKPDAFKTAHLLESIAPPPSTADTADETASDVEKPNSKDEAEERDTIIQIN